MGSVTTMDQLAKKLVEMASNGVSYDDSMLVLAKSSEIADVENLINQEWSQDSHPFYRDFVRDLMEAFIENTEAELEKSPETEIEALNNETLQYVGFIMQILIPALKHSGDANGEPLPDDYLYWAITRVVVRGWCVCWRDAFSRYAISEMDDESKVMMLIVEPLDVAMRLIRAHNKVYSAKDLEEIE